jgi:hypothetical protein
MLVRSSELNQMGEGERRAFSSSALMQKLHLFAASHATFLQWAVKNADDHMLEVRGGSAFFVDTGDAVFGVTAAHVALEYLADVKSGRCGISQVASLQVDLASRFVSIGKSPARPRAADIATFELSYTELKRSMKQAVQFQGARGDGLFEGRGIMLCGCPAATRIWLRPQEMSHGLTTFHVPITSIASDQFSCRIERGEWIDSFETERSAPRFGLGGLSGGPALALYDNDTGCWSASLAGAIAEASGALDVVVVERSHLLTPQGRVLDYA